MSAAVTVFIEGREPISVPTMTEAYSWAELAHELRLFCVCRKGPKVLFLKQSDNTFLDWAERQVEVEVGS